MNLEIRHLRLVEAIVEEGSLTRAGERLHLTQSALSHQLRDIEARLGTRLFLRAKRRMLLTPAGEQLLASARTILSQLRGTEEEIKRLSKEGGGLLRLAVECYTCYHWLPALLGPFRQKFPRVEVRIATEETPNPLQGLLEGRLDLALVHGPVHDRRLHLRPLFEDESVVVLPRDHPLATRRYLNPADFRDQNFFTYSAPEDNITLKRVLLPAGVTPRQITQVRLTEAILEMVKAGYGIAVLAAWSVVPEIDNGALCARRLTRNGFVRRWQAARLRGAPTPPYLTAFEDLLARGPLAVRKANARVKRAIA